MLDITRPRATGAAQFAAARMAFDRAGVPTEVAAAVLEATDPADAVELAEFIAFWHNEFAKAYKQFMDAPKAAQAALDAIKAVLDNPETTTDSFSAQAQAQLVTIAEMAKAAHPAFSGAGVSRSGAYVGRSFDEGAGFIAKMSAGLANRIEPGAGPREVPGMTLSEIAMTCARKAGLRPWNDAEAIRMAAHSTSDFPLILDGAMGNLVARRFEVLEPAIRRTAHEVRRNDYRQGRSLHLSASAMPAEVKEGGEIKFVTVDEKGELLPQLRDVAAGFNITNQTLVNDSTATGLLNDIVGHMADGAVGRFRAVLLEPLLANSGAGQTMADGKALFHADHGNLAASGASLDVTSLTAARTAMHRQKGLQGEIRAVDPWALIVPPELQTTAEQLVAQLAAAQVSEVNPFAGKLEIIVEPGLTDAKAWYLCADPARFDGLAFAFLDGQSRPRVESRSAWSTIGMELRLVWALDAKFIETATWYRNPGA